MAVVVRLLCVLLLVPLWGSAQQSISFATLTGQVEDPTGAVVTGAGIRIVHFDRNQPIISTTDALGRFRFNYLPVGEYEIRIEQSGFVEAVRKVSLSVGQSVDVSITLAIASIAAVVDVTEHIPVVETV